LFCWNRRAILIFFSSNSVSYHASIGGSPCLLMQLSLFWSSTRLYLQLDIHTYEYDQKLSPDYGRTPIPRRNAVSRELAPAGPAGFHRRCGGPRAPRASSSSPRGARTRRKPVRRRTDSSALHSEIEPPATLLTVSIQRRFWLGELHVVCSLLLADHLVKHVSCSARLYDIGKLLFITLERNHIDSIVCRRTKRNSSDLAVRDGVACHDTPPPVWPPRAAQHRFRPALTSNPSSSSAELNKASKSVATTGKARASCGTYGLPNWELGRDYADRVPRSGSVFHRSTWRPDPIRISVEFGQMRPISLCLIVLLWTSDNMHELKTNRLLGWEGPIHGRS
jgi:hypothetical protein